MTNVIKDTLISYLLSKIKKTLKGDSHAQNRKAPFRELPYKNHAHRRFRKARRAVFHRRSCFYADNISINNRVFYYTRQAAINSGKRPCTHCNP